MQKVKAESTKNGLLHRMRKQRLKSITVLPSLITILNGLCGFTAIVFASKATATESGELSLFALAGYMILLAMIADMLDGRVARMSQSTSSFGGQLDSLCDMISFGVAPAFIMLKILEHRLADLVGSVAIVDTFLQRFIWLSAAAYISCAAIRLARFNVENEEDESSHMSFIGLPTPAAAGVVASLVIFQQETLPEVSKHSSLVYSICDETIIYALPFIVLGLAFLMVSRIMYSHVLNQYMKGKKPLAYLLTCLFVLGLIIWFRQVALLVGFCGFAISAFLKRLFSGRALKAEPLEAYDDQM